MTEPSSAAQAVIAAMADINPSTSNNLAAAAFRAAADHVVPEQNTADVPPLFADRCAYACRMIIRRKLLAIADEIEE